MSLGTFLFKICWDVWSFLSDRFRKEYEYIFSTGKKHGVGDSERGDAYVRKIVDGLSKDRGYKYDPYIIGDGLYTWLRIPLIVEIEHLETFVVGLKSLHKAETCGIIEKDGQLYVNANLGAGPIHFNIFAFAKLVYIEQLVTIKASLNYCKVNANFSVNTETYRNGRLQSLYIEEFGDVNVCITGFGCLSWLLSKIITLMMKLNHRMVRNLVEFGMEHKISRSLPCYRLPTENKPISNVSISEILGALGTDDKILQELSTERARQQKIMPNDARNSKVNHDGQIDREESARDTASNEDPSEDDKLKSDNWYTNVPLLEGNAVSQGHNDSESDAENIQIQFQFSKGNVILEDVDPLARPDMTTCCIFFRSETELLQKSESEDTGKYLPFKNSEEFLNDILTGRTSDIGGRSILSEELEKSFANEGTRLCTERLTKTFFKEYPNFIALTYNTHEEQNKETVGLNKEIDNTAEAKVGEVNVEAEDATEDVSLTAGSQYEVMFNRQQGVDDTIELSETVEQSYVLQNRSRNALHCSTLPMDSISGHIGNEKNARAHETSMQEVKNSLKRMNEKCHAISKTLRFQQKNKLIDESTKDYGEKGHGIVEQVKDTNKINRIQNIESILKWTSDSENEESKCFDTKKSTYQSRDVSKSSIQRDFSVSKVIADNPLKISNVRKERSKHKNSKDSLYGREIKKTYENEDITHIKQDVKKGRSFKNSREMQRKNVNEPYLKYDCTSIEQLNAIEVAICKCFENPWVERPSESTFFFTDRESNTFSDFSNLQKSELVEQLDLLEKIKVEELKKETDYFQINLDAILKEETQFHVTPNPISYTTEINSSFQSENTNSDISKVVKNFFEQNPIEKILFEQKTTHPHIGADNESIDELKHLSLKGISISEKNDLNLSWPPMSDFSSIIIDKPSDLLHKSLGEYFARLEDEKFDLPPQDSNNHTVISDVGAQSADNAIDDNHNWSKTSCWDPISHGYFPSYKDIVSIDISSTNDSDFAENASCGMFPRWNTPEMDYLNNNETDAVNRQSTEAPISSAYKKDILYSDNCSLKTSNIRMLDTSKASPNKVNEEQVVDEKIKTKLCKDNKTAAFKEQIVAIKEGETYTNIEKNEFGIQSSKTEPSKFGYQYAKYHLMPSFSFEKLYDTLCEDILLLISEGTESDDVLNMEDDLSEDPISLTDKTERQNNDSTDIIEKLKISTDQQVGKDTLESLDESLHAQSHPDTLDTSSTIEDEYISEQTNLLRSMFEKFVRQGEEAELNSVTETNYQTCSRNLNEPSILENEKVSAILTMDKHTLIERQDKSCGQISSGQDINLWKENVTVDVNRGVSWKQALQIWGVKKANI